MAERKPGPVKPPTIELTARPVTAGAGRRRRGTEAPESGAETAGEATAPRVEREDAAAVEPTAGPAAADPVAAETSVPPSGDAPAAETAAEAEPPEPPPPERPEPPPPPAGAGRANGTLRTQPWDVIAFSALAGALLGTALTYVLATLVPLPASEPVIPDLGPQLADDERRLENLEASTAAIADQATRTQVSLDATIAQLDNGLAELRKAIDDAVARVPAPADVSEIETRLRAVSSRLDAVAAGASSADSEALAQSLTTLQTSLTEVSARLDALERARTATEGTLGTLQDTLAGLESRLETEAEADEQAVAGVDRAAAADALQEAVASGGPFATPLSAVAGSEGIAIPQELEARAGTGLPSPEALAQRFAARVPDMLAAQPPAPGGGWQEQAVDWVKAMLAVRPAEEVAGDTPEAVMSRLEAAMARHDFTEAAGLFMQLPEPMRAAAGDVAADVALWAAAEDLIARLRATPAGAAP